MINNWEKNQEKELDVHKCLVCERFRDNDDFDSEESDICLECSSDRQFMDRSLKETHGIAKCWNISIDKRTAREELFVQQKGCCAICGVSEEDNHKKLALDHDHETDIIRGLLCDMCNGMLGLARDSTHTLRQAIKYLEANGI